MMRNSSTYVYLALVLGLGCYLTFIDKKNPGTDAIAASETYLFPPFDPKTVTELEITNVHGTFIFEKVDGHWEIKTPVETLADGNTVDDVINQIHDAKPSEVIDPDRFTDDNLQQWGLLPTPAERAVIHIPGKTYELYLGRKTAINADVYARASGRKNEPVRVISSTIMDVLQKDLSDFRSRNVFDFAPDSVTQISSRTTGSATVPGQQCELVRKNGKWKLQMPLVARADDGDVQRQLNSILAIRALDFTSDEAGNLSQYGLTTPSETLSVTIKPDPAQPEEELTLQIGSAVPKEPDQVYAQRLKSNSVFTINRSSIDDILKALPTVRDRHVFPFDPLQATSLTISYGTKQVNIRREHDLWTLEGDVKAGADAGKVNDVLNALVQLQTTPALKDSVTDLKTYGLLKPLGTITVESPEFKDGNPLVLRIGKTESHLIYVRNSTEPFIYTLPETALNFLPENNLTLRDVRVIKLDRNNVSRMTITDGNAPPITIARSSGGTWSTVNIKDRMVNSLKAETQASLICQLQAKTWLGPVLPAYGLAKPSLTFSLVTDKPTPTILNIGAALPDGGHAAQVVGDPSAFELAESDYDMISTSSLQAIPPALQPSGTNAPPTAPKPPTPSSSPSQPPKN